MGPVLRPDGKTVFVGLNDTFTYGCSTVVLMFHVPLSGDNSRDTVCTYTVAGTEQCRAVCK